MISSRCKALALILGGLLSPGFECPLGATPQQRHREIVEVTEVAVPVNVIREGAPVRGLGRDDFKLTAAGKKREISGFSVIDLTQDDLDSPSSGSELPLFGRRHIMLLFDLAFANPSSIVRARHAAMELVDQGMHPTDLVGVASYSSRFGMKVHLGFTDDRDTVRLAIESLGFTDVIQLYLRAADDDLEILRANPASESRSGPSDLSVDTVLQSHLEAMVVEDSRAVQGHFASGLVSSLEQLAGALSPINGRKQLIYLSEGFPSSLLVGTASMRAIQKMNDAVNRGEYWKVDSTLRYGRVDQRNHLREALQQFVDADGAIHAVDVGGIRPGFSKPGQETLFIMADRTGGEFLHNYNNLNKAMEEVLERTSITYLLSFKLTDNERDGQRHKIKVRLKKGSQGTRLLYRPSFVATDSIED